MADVLWPQANVNPANPLEGGYAFGDWSTLGNAFHPGADLNTGSSADADYGEPIIAVCDGVVVFVRTWEESGYGYHVWYRCQPGGSTFWVHHAHMRSDVQVQEGRAISRGDVLGFVSKSGGQTFCHDHMEVRDQAPRSFSYWPVGIQDRATALTGYVDPVGWLTDTLPTLLTNTEAEVVLTPDQQAMLDLMNPSEGMDGYDPAHPGLFINADGVRQLISDRDALTAQNKELWDTNGQLQTQLSAAPTAIAPAPLTGEYGLVQNPDGSLSLTPVK